MSDRAASGITLAPGHVRFSGLWALLALTALITAACSSTARTAPSNPDSRASTTAAARSPVAGADSRSATVAVTAPSSAPPDVDAAKRVCQAISINLGVLTKAASSPNDPSLDQGIAQLRQLRDVAPVDIKRDLQVIADFDQKVLTVIRSGASPNDIRETPELTAALSHQSHWVAAHCPA